MKLSSRLQFARPCGLNFILFAPNNRKGNHSRISLFSSVLRCKPIGRNTLPPNCTRRRSDVGHDVLVVCFSSWAWGLAVPFELILKQAGREKPIWDLPKRAFQDHAPELAGCTRRITRAETPEVLRSGGPCASVAGRGQRLRRRSACPGAAFRRRDVRSSIGERSDRHLHG